MSTLTMFCPFCTSSRVAWIGRTERYARKDKPHRDIERCSECGRAWYYARTGRPMRVRL